MVGGVGSKGQQQLCSFEITPLPQGGACSRGDPCCRLSPCFKMMGLLHVLDFLLSSKIKITQLQLDRGCMVDEEPPSGCDIAKLMNIYYSEVKALRSGNAHEAKKVSSGHWDNPLTRKSVKRVYNVLILLTCVHHYSFVLEVPPPPVNVQYSDVKQTEARITWSHPELYEVYAISSYLLQVKKFGTKTWTQFADTRGDNHRLTNLEQGTPYIVRLKSVNKFGRGDPSETLELQTESNISVLLLLLS